MKRHDGGDGEIVEGDWFGLARHELHRHGRSLSSMLADLLQL